jgi:hypothetical protein
MRYAFVIEKARRNYSASAFDLPGASPAELDREGGTRHRKAIRFYIDRLNAEGLPAPAPTSIVEYVNR